MVRDIFQEQNLEINFKRLLFLRGINHLETRREPGGKCLKYDKTRRRQRWEMNFKDW